MPMNMLANPEPVPVGRVAAHLLEVLEPLEQAKDLLGGGDGRVLPSDVVERNVVFVRVDDVAVAARQEPEHGDELEDDERHDEDEVDEHPPVVGQRGSGMQEGVARGHADEEVADQDVDREEDDRAFQPAPVSTVPFHQGSRGMRGKGRPSVRSPRPWGK
jgi:hypothetical protein